MLGNKNSTDIKEPKILSALTKPLSELIIQLDKKTLDEIATAGSNQTNVTRKLIKQCYKMDGNGTKLAAKCK